MATKIIKYSATKAALFRFVRTFVPQVPAIIAAFEVYGKAVPLPSFVIPTLILGGALITTADKMCRNNKVY